jgi:hypothetical protein
MNARSFRLLSLTVIGTFLLAACGTGNPSPTVAPVISTIVPTSPPAATSTLAPTATPASTETPAGSATPAASPTPAVSATSAVIATSAVTATPAVSATSAASATSAPTATLAPTTTSAGPQPTTPAMDLVVAYYRLEVCTNRAPAFKIVNTGSAALSSYSIVVKDNTNKNSLSKTSDDFNQRQGCTVVSDTPSLTYGQVGYIYSKNFSYDPTGDDMTATVTVCTRDGLAGKCLSQVVHFTP